MSRRIVSLRFGRDPESQAFAGSIVRALSDNEPDLPPFLCPACGHEHYRVSAHGLLRPNAVQGRRALCDGCLGEAGIGA